MSIDTKVHLLEFLHIPTTEACEFTMPERLAQRKRHALEKSGSQWAIQQNIAKYIGTPQSWSDLYLNHSRSNIWCSASRFCLLRLLAQTGVHSSLSAQTNNSMPVSDSVKGSWMWGTAQYIAHTCATPGEHWRWIPGRAFLWRQRCHGGTPKPRFFDDGTYMLDDIGRYDLLKFSCFIGRYWVSPCFT